MLLCLLVKGQKRKKESSLTLSSVKIIRNTWFEMFPELINSLRSKRTCYFKTSFERLIDLCDMLVSLKRSTYHVSLKFFVALIGSFGTDLLFHYGGATDFVWESKK